MCHPDTPPVAVRAVRVAWHGMTLRWVVEGAGALVVPAPVAAPARRDGLWQTTCFELFLRDHDGAYREINLSPSGDWACYAFDGYRRGMVDAPWSAPLFQTQQGEDFTLTAFLPHDVLAGARHASLSVVIEEEGAEEGGRKSYWALAHAPGPPDFHSPTCFTLPIGAAQGA